MTTTKWLAVFSHWCALLGGAASGQATCSQMLGASGCAHYTPAAASLSDSVSQAAKAEEAGASGATPEAEESHRVANQLLQPLASK